MYVRLEPKVKVIKAITVPIKVPNIKPEAKTKIDPKPSKTEIQKTPKITKVIETKNKLDSLRLTRYSLLDLMKLQVVISLILNLENKKYKKTESSNK